MTAIRSDSGSSVGGDGVSSGGGIAGAAAVGGGSGGGLSKGTLSRSQSGKSEGDSQEEKEYAFVHGKFVYKRKAGTLYKRAATAREIELKIPRGHRSFSG